MKHDLFTLHALAFMPYNTKRKWCVIPLNFRVETDKDCLSSFNPQHMKGVREEETEKEQRGGDERGRRWGRESVGE